LQPLVAINRFTADTEAEMALVEEATRAAGLPCVRSDGWAEGGKGAQDLARAVAALCEEPSAFTYAYEDELSIEDKLNAIAKKVYHADGVSLTDAAKKQARQLTALGFSDLPICMAKTQYSFSDNPKLLGAPNGFTVTVRALRVCAGAGFIVALTGDIMTMPGLPKVPAAEKIDVDENGVISGMF